MTIPTTEEEIAFLDLSNFKNGEHVMFCIACNWQTKEHVAMKAVCPECCRPLRIMNVNHDKQTRRCKSSSLS